MIEIYKKAFFFFESKVSEEFNFSLLFKKIFKLFCIIFYIYYCSLNQVQD